MAKIANLKLHYISKLQNVGICSTREIHAAMKILLSTISY